MDTNTDEDQDAAFCLSRNTLNFLEEFLASGVLLLLKGNAETIRET
jgi:hypothetical protein